VEKRFGDAAKISEMGAALRGLEGVNKKMSGWEHETPLGGKKPGQQKSGELKAKDKREPKKKRGGKVGAMW